MGLFDKLRNEFVDIIEWIDDTRNTLVWRFPRYQNEIKQGAQLIVRPGQLAVRDSPDRPLVQPDPVGRVRPPPRRPRGRPRRGGPQTDVRFGQSDRRRRGLRPDAFAGPPLRFEVDRPGSARKPRGYERTSLGSRTKSLGLSARRPTHCRPNPNFGRSCGACGTAIAIPLETQAEPVTIDRLEQQLEGTLQWQTLQRQVEDPRASCWIDANCWPAPLPWG